MKEIEDDKNKGRDILCSGPEITEIVKINALPKTNCKFNAIPLPNSNDIFHRTRRNNSKIL